MTVAEANSKKKATEALREAGAVLEKREDQHGDTHIGWWLDGVYLGPASDPCYALNILRGN